MSMRFHFISGLPRSGSTLLAALLRQNPRFRASMSSPLCGLFETVTGALSGSNEFAPFITDAQRERVARGLFENYYGEVSENEQVFDTSRGWCAHMAALKRLFPECRVIACVRDTPKIVESFERLLQEHPFTPPSIVNFSPGGSVYSRVNSYFAPNGVIGFAYQSLRQAFFGPHADSLMLLQYETLANNPAHAMEAVYQFLGEAPFAHDFDHVELDVSEYDARSGNPGLHQVRSKVGMIQRPSLLPPDIAQRFQHDAFWRQIPPGKLPARIV